MPIGQLGTNIGFAAINQYFCKLIGFNPALYTLTDAFGIIPLITCAAFAVLGITQWVRRKSIFKVDKSLFILGGTYILVISVFVLFEILVINYRPVLICGRHEASYPSSTTLLTLTVMPTAIMQIKERAKNKRIYLLAAGAIVLFITATVVLRLLSGVHWFTDIVGGALISAGIVLGYRYLID
jgi:undecaprenyl-diphosphatase